MSEQQRDVQQVSADVEKCWQEFWAPIVAPNGVLNLNQVKLELADFHMVIGEVSLVYDHVTRGRISKPTTLAREVIAVADDVTNDACDEAVKEAREDWEAGGVVADKPDAQQPGE